MAVQSTQCRKMFLWKGCHDILPTKETLFRKQVVHDMLCPICERETKLVLHILWSCPSAQDVWGSGPMKFQKGCNTGVNFTQWFEEMMGHCSVEELELLTVVARWIWFRRKSIVHEGEFTHSN